MKTKTINIYDFDELPTENAKDKAREWCRDIYESEAWWSYIYDDAAAIGLSIDGHDFLSVIGCSAVIVTSAPECAEAINLAHGHNTDTFQIAKWYLKKLEGLETPVVDPDDPDYDKVLCERYDIIRERMDAEFTQQLINAYYKMLTDEYAHITSDECVDEQMRANNYTFRDTGVREDI